MDSRSSINSEMRVITSLILLGFFIFSFSNVSAFGVTTPYWDTNPLNMVPGETQTVSLILQNMVGEEDITLKADIKKGTDIAKIIDPDNTYLVPYGTKNTPVNIEVSIPKETKVGESYDIEVQFVQTSSENGKVVQFTGAVGTIIPIEVKEEIKTSSFSTSATATLTIILVIIVILTIVFTRRVNNKKRKR